MKTKNRKPLHFPNFEYGESWPKEFNPPLPDAETAEDQEASSSSTNTMELACTLMTLKQPGARFFNVNGQ